MQKPISLGMIQLWCNNCGGAFPSFFKVVLSDYNETIISSAFSAGDLEVCCRKCGQLCFLHQATNFSGILKIQEIIELSRTSNSTQKTPDSMQHNDDIPETGATECLEDCETAKPVGSRDVELFLKEQQDKIWRKMMG